MTLRPDQIGDRPRRYEVRFAAEGTPSGQFNVVGYAEDEPEAQTVARMWKETMSRLRPELKLVVWIADRQCAVSIYDADVYDPAIDASRLGMPSGDTQEKDST